MILQFDVGLKRIILFVSLFLVVATGCSIYSCGYRSVETYMFRICSLSRKSNPKIGQRILINKGNNKIYS